MSTYPNKVNPLCNICGSVSNALFTQKILNQYSVKYYKCTNCEFIQTETPYWLTEAYESAINIEDTGIVQRNLLLAVQLTPFFLTMSKSAKFLDYGGGFGTFTRIMRDLGFDAYWEDPLCKNLLARGFEAKKKDLFQLVTALELFEHISNPQKLLKMLLKRSDIILFSTQTHDKVTDIANWWYMGYSHGQHISLYSKKSIELLASLNSAHAASIGSNIHVISKKPLNRLQKVLLHKMCIIFFPLVFILRKSKTFSDHKMLLR